GDGAEVGRQDRRVGEELALHLRVAHERADDAQAVPGRALDLVRVLLEQPVDGGTDRAVAEQRDGDVDASGGHSLILTTALYLRHPDMQPKVPELIAP